MLTKEKTILLTIASFFALLFIWVVISVMAAPPKSPDLPEGIACPMDAKICPDGSSVGRVGPNCEFAACPGEVSIPETPGTKVPPPVPVPVPVTDGSGGAVACTMDAKMCPDGSYVGRTGPNCEFAPCPVSIPPPSGTMGSCTSDADCAEGYSCIDASPVVREGTQNLRCWKNGAPRPICLSGETRIGTPTGEVLVKNIHAGDVVWSVDKNGEKIAVPVLLSSHTNAPTDHHVVHLTLRDGRELFASPGHKVADGRTLGSLRAGDVFETSLVAEATLVAYHEAYTYDILPEGDTGMYVANGMLLQSTLKN